MRFMRQAVAICLLAIVYAKPCTAEGTSPVAPFEARYSVSSRGFTLGVMTRTLALEAGARYRFSSDFSTTGLAAVLKRVVVHESSAGRLVNGRLQPERYRYRRESGKKVQESGVDFDWPSMVARGFNGEHQWTVELRGDELDKLVYQVALAIDLHAHRTSLVYEVPDNGKRQRFELALVGKEPVMLWEGQTLTERVEHSRRDSRRTTLWCDPSLGYLPVQI